MLLPILGFNEIVMVLSSPLLFMLLLLVCGACFVLQTMQPGLSAMLARKASGALTGL